LLDGAPLKYPRPWVKKLRKKVSKAKRAILKENTRKLKVVIKKHKADGTMSVTLGFAKMVQTRFFDHWSMINFRN